MLWIVPCRQYVQVPDPAAIIKVVCEKLEKPYEIEVAARNPNLLHLDIEVYS